MVLILLPSRCALYSLPCSHCPSRSCMPLVAARKNELAREYMVFVCWPCLCMHETNLLLNKSPCTSNHCARTNDYIAVAAAAATALAGGAVYTSKTTV